MPFRVACLFLTLVMLWSAFATQEQTFHLESSSTEQTATALMGQLPQPAHDGSVEDHHLDDQPVQVHVEGGGTDSYGLLPARVCTLPVAVTLAGYQPYAEAFWLAPDLDGPQRPPRAIALIA